MGVCAGEPGKPGKTFKLFLFIIKSYLITHCFFSAAYCKTVQWPGYIYRRHVRARDTFELRTISEGQEGPLFTQ